MSAPTAAVVKSLAERIGLILDEYDDAAYSLSVLDNEGNWAFFSRATPFQKMVIARVFLEDAIVDVETEAST